MRRTLLAASLSAALLLPPPGFRPPPAQAQAAASRYYDVVGGKIEFHSNAPKELIQAASTRLQGLVDISKRTFAFRIEMASFIGFNSPLQREHFNENYMETARFPLATFSGKIIEETDLGKDGSYQVRAKGQLGVHGLSQERIIPARVVVKGGKATLEADFTVALADHNIKIPRVVYDKLAPEIKVSIRASLQSRG
jgi:polyisoprenoid-binding protein YceI